MPQIHTRRPRVSRETRLLLTTALLAVGVLWMLARVRFPDQPAPANPVQPLLTQLAARPRHSELAAEIAQLRSRLEPLLAGPGLRVRNDAALALLDAGDRAEAVRREDVLSADRASGLALLRTPFLPAPPPVQWNPGDLGEPQYLVAADASTGMLSLRPVFVGALTPIESPIWPDEVWALPPATGVRPGWFVFTTDGLLAGLVVEEAGRPAMVPGRVLLAEADRLLATPAGVPGGFGIDVQALTAAVAKATGAPAGVVVTWVDPDGPAAAGLMVGDVLESAGDAPLPTPIHWAVRVARTSAGEQLTVRVRRSGQLSAVVLIASEAAQPPAGLGLELRAAPGTGSLVTDLRRGSAADRAGLRTGDLITRAGDTTAPPPAAVRRAFDRTAAGAAMLVAYVRAGAPAVTAIEK